MEHCAIAMRQDICLSYYRGHNYTSEDLGPNPTYLSDWIFKTCTPVMVIRHPALSVRSLYETMSQISYNRPGSEDFHFCTSLHYCRLLFDLFKSQGRNPIVVDGEDVLWRTKEITTNICESLGIGPEGVTEEWEPTPVEKRPTNPIILGLTKTIHESSGILRPEKKVCTLQVFNLTMTSGTNTCIKPSGPISVEEELGKMTNKYGEEIANDLKKYILEYLPDYEYLVQFKL